MNRYLLIGLIVLLILLAVWLAKKDCMGGSCQSTSRAICDSNSQPFSNTQTDMYFIGQFADTCVVNNPAGSPYNGSVTNLDACPQNWTSIGFNICQNNANPSQTADFTSTIYNDTAFQNILVNGTNTAATVGVYNRLQWANQLGVDWNGLNGTSYGPVAGPSWMNGWNTLATVTGLSFSAA